MAGRRPDERVRIALLHSWPDQTADALPRIISGSQEAGTVFLTVSQALEGV